MCFFVFRVCILCIFAFFVFRVCMSLEFAFFLCSVFAFFWRLRVVGVLGLYVLAVQLQCLHSATNLHCSR